MRGVLHISDVLGVDMRLQALWEPLGLQRLKVEGMQTDSDAMGDPLASLSLGGKPAHTLADSAHLGLPLGLENSIPDSGSVLAKSVCTLGESMHSGSRSETGGLVLTTGMVQEWLVTMGDGARRGGRVQNEWWAV